MSIPMANEIARLLENLKRAYKTAGIRYADAAQALGVSDLTIKRWMTGKGLTVAALARLCEVADTTIGELTTTADARQELPLVTNAQAETIATDIVLGMTHYLLTRRWSAERIMQELRLDEPTMTRRLTLLDRIGVIALFPGNRVRLLRRMSGNIRDNAATFTLVARRVHEFFDRPDLSDPTIAWTNGIARLSRSSFTQMSERLDQLRDELFALGERDLDLPQDDVAWYTLFAAARPVSLEALLYETKPGKDA